MARILNVYLLPDMIQPQELAGDPCVVIDVLRASTTIITALAAQADGIIPCLEVEEARQLAVDRPGALLAGERGGKKIPGFILGNSPAEFTPAVVGGKSIVFTTTNGTRALMRCLGSSRILLGGLVNRRSLAMVLLGVPDDRISLVCAGTDGRISLDDVLTAGAIAQALLVDGAWKLDDAARLCLAYWEQVSGEETPAPPLPSPALPTPSARHDSVISALRHSLGGSTLIALGMDRDIALAAELDRYRVVPELDQRRWIVRDALDSEGS